MKSGSDNYTEDPESLIVPAIIGCIFFGLFALYCFAKLLGYTDPRCFFQEQGSFIGAIIGAVVLAGTVVYTIKHQSKTLKIQLDHARELVILETRERDIDRIRECLMDIRMTLNRDYTYLLDSVVREQSRFNIISACNSISSITQKMKV
ncbi:MAG TPA: hypothetical protein VIG40_03845, partial [Tissierellaceae bacterium]